jgi:hypothetical protein
MPRVRLSSEERKQRRREAALKGIAARAVRQEMATATATSEAPPVPSAPAAARLVARAQAIGREGDLYYHAHLKRWPHKPSQWTPEVIAQLTTFLDGFIRPDGTPQPVPHCRRKSR